MRSMQNQTITQTSTATSAQSVWRAPQLSMRWWPVFLRNLLVWRKLAIPSLVGNIAEPLMWLVAFGYGMGALVGKITVDGVPVPYIPVSYTHLRAHETVLDLVCRLLLDKKKKKI